MEPVRLAFVDEAGVVEGSDDFTRGKDLGHLLLAIVPVVARVPRRERNVTIPPRAPLVSNSYLCLVQSKGSVECRDPKIRLASKPTTYADVSHDFRIYGANVPSS